MSHQDSHLSTQDIMLLTQHIFRGISRREGFSYGLKKIISSKTRNENIEISDVHLQHLTNCPKCLFDVWDSYLSAETLREVDKDSMIPRMSIRLDSIKSSFEAFFDRGFLLPVSLTPAVSVRSSSIGTTNATSKKPAKNMTGATENLDYLTKATYVLMIPAYPEMLAHLQIKCLSEGLEFSIELKTKFEGTFTFSLHKNNKLMESQNVTSQLSQLTFFVGYEERRSHLSKSKLSLFVTKEREKDAHKVLELVT